MAELLVRVCPRVEDARDPVQGSTRACCSRCLAPIWVGPSPLAALLLCVQCAAPDMSGADVTQL